MDGYSISRHGQREYAIKGNRTYFTRRAGEEWRAVEQPPSCDAELPLFLALVREKQAEGEPYHWYLFVAEEGESGHVYSVTGDATFMQYKIVQDVDILASDSYLDSLELATLDQAGAAKVHAIATSEPPPQAVNRAAVRENCQGWTIRVVEKLVAQGIVSSGKCEAAKLLMQPV